MKTDNFKYLIGFVIAVLFLTLVSWTRTASIGSTVYYEKVVVDNYSYIIATSADGIAICPAK